MAFQMITAASVGVGPRVFLATNGDGAFVASGVLVASNDDVAILGEVGDLRLILDGTVATGGAAAVHLGDSAVFDTNHTVFVGRTGVVRGPSTALYIQGHDSQVTNYGDIGGGAVGITLSGQGAGQTRVINHGLISADTGIMRSTGTDSEGMGLLNMGAIEGRIWAYDGLLSDTTDTITNRGQIFGDVRLGGGVDVFDTRGAGEVAGKVFGGTGDDRFLLGAAEDVIDGGTGIDTIDATASGAIILALDASVAGTGRTLGDTLTAIETILGCWCNCIIKTDDGGRFEPLRLHLAKLTFLITPFAIPFMQKQDFTCRIHTPSKARRRQVSCRHLAIHKTSTSRRACDLRPPMTAPSKVPKAIT